MKKMLAAVIALTMLLISAQAYDGGITLPEDDFSTHPGEIILSTAEGADAGSVLTVTVGYTRSIASELCFDVDYDNTVLTLTGVSTSVQNGSVLKNGDRVEYTNEGGGNSDVLVTLTFSVAKNVSDGTVTEIRLINAEDEEYYLENASVSVTLLNGARIGDINGDGTVDGDDCEMLTKYLAGRKNATLTSPENADIDGDKKITARDRAILARFVAGWNTYDAYFA